MRDREVVLFIGAGASKLAGLPTVEHFFEEVVAGPQPGFLEHYERMAQRIEVGEGTKQAIKWPNYDAEKLFGRLEQWVNTASIAGEPPTARLAPGNATLAIPAADLLTHLKREIVRIYGRAPGLRACARCYADLFSLLVQKKAIYSPFWVFTTNYDTVIDQLLRDANFQNRIPKDGTGALDLRTGFVAGTPARWDPDVFAAPRRLGFCPVNLVKLHGSVTWKWDGEGEARQPYDTGLATPTGEYDCLVYFGYKSIPEIEPFKTLHRLLKKTLLRNVLVLAIGFPFADPYIRETFDSGLRANDHLQIICSLTSAPPSGSPLRELMDTFPDQVSLLVGEDGYPLPFGHGKFCEEFEKRLELAD